MGYFYILLTILFTVYGQLVLKWRINIKGNMPVGWTEKLNHIYELLLDFYVISSFAAAFLASITWMIALEKFDLSFAYPFMSLAFVLVLIFSCILFNEPITATKVISMILIISGIIIGSK